MDSAVNLSNLPRKCTLTVNTLSENVVSLCRGCLSFDAKLYNLFDAGLAGDFEELVRTGVRIDINNIIISSYVFQKFLIFVVDWLIFYFHLDRQIDIKLY